MYAQMHLLFWQIKFTVRGSVSTEYTIGRAQLTIHSQHIEQSKIYGTAKLFNYEIKVRV